MQSRRANTAASVARSAKLVSEDARYAELDEAMQKHSRNRSSLVEVLHVAQKLFGYLDREVLEFVRQGLDLPASRVYGVATFYHLFSLVPQGRRSCVVCLGTACFVKSAEALESSIQRTLGIASGETTRDGEWSLSRAHCLGYCSLAPLVVLDGALSGPVRDSGVAALLHGEKSDPSEGGG